MDTVPNDENGHVDYAMLLDDAPKSLSNLFEGCVIYLDYPDKDSEGDNWFARLTNMLRYTRELDFVRTYIRFGRGQVVKSLEDEGITHIVVSETDRSRLSQIRRHISRFVVS
jgi:hypothetical protein